MTNQKYKLVPVEPTGKMTDAAVGALPESLHRLGPVSINAAIRHAIAAAPECKEPPVAWWNGMQETPLGGMPPSIQWGADAEDTRHDIPLYAGFNPVHTHPAAPEPVCRWLPVDEGWFVPECTVHDVEDGRPRVASDPFCPHCGKKVEVAGDE